MNKPAYFNPEQFAEGQKVKFSGYDATVVRYYGSGMWEIRVPGGVTCVSGSDIQTIDPDTVGWYEVQDNDGEWKRIGTEQAEQMRDFGLDIRWCRATQRGHGPIDLADASLNAAGLPTYSQLLCALKNVVTNPRPAGFTLPTTEWNARFKAYNDAIDTGAELVAKAEGK